MVSGQGEVTELLHALSSGRSDAWDELMPVVYQKLKGLAQARLRREHSPQALQTTALVHEAFVNLVDQRRARFADRAHFYAVASLAMRRVLVDAARARRRQKRGSGELPLSLSDLDVGHAQTTVSLIALGESLDRLDEASPRARQVVECRVFGGMTIDETAVALKASPMTIKRDWRMARAWLARELLPT